ncbi:MAG: hypothetical protein J0I79_15910 [Mesorhizobium sp.]|uniref:hypothetical protein n=1 Tax=Mesorhizobium sp. TaxID=1871066 RepID=UPI001ACD1FF2|nr:hypothetical protein [Mesorhizobium sp.]MBN9219430.1 hypothetical protein [Mesorhizobium sp.]
MTEAIHPPLDHLSSRRGKRFEPLVDFFAGARGISLQARIFATGAIRKGSFKNKTGQPKPPCLREGLGPPSKENDHLAVLVVMMMVPPPELLVVMVVVMVVVVVVVVAHAMSRGRLHGAGKRAGGDENGNEA